MESNYLDFSHLSLKDDAVKRPLWVCGDGKVIIETFAENAKAATDFIASIGYSDFSFCTFLPSQRSLRIARTTFISTEYLNSRYTQQCLSESRQKYVFFSSNTSSCQDIVKKLETWSKVELPAEVVKFVSEASGKYS